MKYNVGDKFVIEIERKYEVQGLYKVEGLNNLFNEYTLDKLATQNYGEKTEFEEYIDRMNELASVRDHNYNRGLEDAWKIATMIYKSAYHDGLKGFEVKKYFSCTIDEIHKLPIQEVVKGFRRYEEDKNLDWSKVPVDTPILVRDNDANVWKKRYFAKYEDGKVHTWRGGKTSWSNNGATTIEWNQAKLPEEE